jgi:hypothetical protein
MIDADRFLDGAEKGNQVLQLRIPKMRGGKDG